MDGERAGIDLTYTNVSRGIMLDGMAKSFLSRSLPSLEPKQHSLCPSLTLSQPACKSFMENHPPLLVFLNPTPLPT